MTLLAVSFAAASLFGGEATQGGVNTTLTAVPGIKVGHYTFTERPTGCTVVVIEAGAVAGVDVRGGAPATRETDLLGSTYSVEKIHALVLAGGSAFGLDAASGVMRYLDERGIGLKVGHANVPIVPAAALFDLLVGNDPTIRPTSDSGYRAAEQATTEPVPEGNVGAGTGATVGKLTGLQRGMKGGLGSAAIVLPNGLIIAALVAVNAFGDVVDPATGQVIAGVRTSDGKRLADARTLLRSGIQTTRQLEANTTLGIVATNAILTKNQVIRVAQMAQDGFARAIVPVHTPRDGDAVFALATGSYAGPVDVGLIGALAADAVAEAITRAVRQATSIKDWPAARDLGK